MPLSVVIEKVNTALRGRAGYVHYRRRSRAFNQLTFPVEGRVRTHLRKRHRTMRCSMPYLLSFKISRQERPNTAVDFVNRAESHLRNATGVSFGSAHTIPTLLLPDEISGRQLTDITEAQRIDDAEIDSVKCYRIQSKYAGEPVTIWIDATTFLVRRIETQKSFTDFSTETVTTYNPILNGVITEEMLAFNPPA